MSQTYRGESSHRPLDPFQRDAEKSEAPEHPIVEIRRIFTEKFGITPEDLKGGFPSEVKVQETTVAVYTKDGMFLPKVVTLEAEDYMGYPIENENDDRPYSTFVIMGGGSSTGIDNMHLMLKALKGIRNYNQENPASPFPTRVRIVLLPHIGGTLREVDKDPAKQDTYREAAEILNEVLNTKEVGATRDIVLMGFSAGGAQVTELAPLLGERCKLLVLGDAAGMAEYPELGFEFGAGQVISAVRKYLDAGKLLPIALYLGLKELIAGTSTRYGSLKTIFDLVKDFTDPVRHSVSAHDAPAYGMNTKTPEVLPQQILEHDSTKFAREKIEAPVIFAPMLYAKVVNTIYQRLKESYDPLKISDPKGLASLSKDQFDSLCYDVVSDLFPKVPPNQRYFLPHESTMHTGYLDDPFWKNITEAMAKVLGGKK